MGQLPSRVNFAGSVSDLLKDSSTEDYPLSAETGVDIVITHECGTNCCGRGNRVVSPRNVREHYVYSSSTIFICWLFLPWVI